MGRILLLIAILGCGARVGDATPITYTVSVNTASLDGTTGLRHDHRHRLHHKFSCRARTGQLVVSGRISADNRAFSADISEEP